jgi:ABC-type transport system substrate-binding protein
MDLYLTYYMPVTESPSTVFYPLLINSLAGETNFLYYNDKAIQIFLNQLFTESTPDKRSNIVQGLIQEIADKPPVIFLYKPKLNCVARNNIFNIELNPIGYVDLRRAYIKTRADEGIK